MSGERRESRKKQISIRGVDEGLYKQVAMLARELGVNVGTLINQALEMFLSHPDVRKPGKLLRAAVEVPIEFREGLLDAKGQVICDIDELVISREDLENADIVSFRSIGRLEFKEDIDIEIFMEKVRSISFCKEVVIPKSLPKIAVLTKCRHVEKIVTKSSGEGK